MLMTDGSSLILNSVGKMMVNKVCSSCGLTKLVNEFYKDSSTKYGYKCYCKDCDRLKRNHKKRTNSSYLPIKKKCSKCGSIKLQSEFAFASINSTGLYSWCKQCVANSQKDHSLRSRYGITEKEYNNLLVQQQCVCVICAKKEISKHQNGNIKELAVDHNHVTNEIRGLLCQKCNTILGLCNEDINILESAITYIKEHSHS